VRLLYLHYGPQSGVTAAVSRCFAAAGVEVVTANPTERFLWQLRPGSKIPNPRPAAVRAFLEAVRQHGRAWKAYWVHTPYAFDHLSRVAEQEIRRAGASVVLQSGVLFAPGRAAGPFHLYVDHTRAIAERYEPAPGLPPPLPADPAWRAREERVYRAASTIFSMSEFAARSLVRDYGVEPARVRVVGAGPNVVPRPCDRGAERVPAILFVGRDFAAKGGPELLDAFRRVRAAHPAARLWIVSQGPAGPLPPGATFHGTVGADVLAGLYSRASVFALPTLREAFGLAFVEAMSFGLPVVGSRIEAIPEIVGEGEAGLLVPPRDPAALAAALSSLLADPARGRALGAAGRARAAERFGWDRAVGRMLEALRPGRALPAAPEGAARAS
jgi:glycosyltransferase involved in cell wall biosynthesis